MATKIVNKFLLRRSNYLKYLKYKQGGFRTFLSEAYSCNEAWEKRFDDPLLTNVNMAQFFIDVDKKFQTKRLTSGADIDIFANKITEKSQIEELEHLLYKFRRTKRAIELLDSTTYAVVKSLINFQDFETLFRILRDRVDYGIFPDLPTYNLLMDLFLKLEQYRDATEIAVLMMLQEDFSNPISRILALYSCMKYLDQEQMEPWEKYLPEISQEIADQEEEEDEDELDEKLIRVPFIRNPWFDDHFDIKDPKCLIGKTLYLVGREENNTLGRTCQLMGLAMWGKWEKANKLLEQPAVNFYEEGISKFQALLPEIADEETKQKWTSEFNTKFEILKKENRLDSGLNACLEEAVNSTSQHEGKDIQQRKEEFLKWPKQRLVSHQAEAKDIDKEKRLQNIKKIKEELYWKEKYLFFFENQDQIDNEVKEVDKIIEALNAKVSAEDAYVPPEMTKKKPSKISKYRQLAMIKTFTPQNK